MLKEDNGMIYEAIKSAYYQGWEAAHINMLKETVKVIDSSNTTNSAILRDQIASIIDANWNQECPEELADRIIAVIMEDKKGLMKMKKAK